MFCDNKNDLIPEGTSIIRSDVGEVVDIEVHGMETFTEKQKLFMGKTVTLMEVVYSSLEFRNEVLNTFMSSREGMSYSEIYKKCLSTVSTYDKVNDEVIAISVELYNGWQRVLGKTVMSTGKMYTNRAFLNSCIVFNRPWNYAGHLAHERMHTLGFKDLRPMKTKSVPYVYGNIMSKLAKRYYEGGSLTTLSNKG